MSDKLLGVWVTTLLLSKRGAVTGRNTRLEAVIDSAYLQTQYEFHDSRTRVLGHSLYHKGDGVHNHVTVELRPVWIGWTRNGGETFITDDDLILEHGTGPLGKILVGLGRICPYTSTLKNQCAKENKS